LIPVAVLPVKPGQRLVKCVLVRFAVAVNSDQVKRELCAGWRLPDRAEMETWLRRHADSNVVGYLAGETIPID
ncbi:MAG: hypothetical protein ACD_58C00190G0001, partial [uncultured bacterium]